MTSCLAWRLLLAALAAPLPGSAQTRDATFLDVEGRVVRIRAAGLNRDSRVPTVVLESGFRARLEAWDPVYERVAALAPVLAYDRAGNGASEDDGHLPTPRHVAERLHAVLKAARAKPPYVLAGHSWGGPLVRMFAALYPGEVAGIVYVDPTDLRPKDEEVQYYREQGYDDQAMRERKASLLRFGNPDQGETKVLVDAVKSDFKEFRSLPALPDVPMAILMSAKFGPASWKGAPCAPKRCEEVLVGWRLHWLTAMMEGVKDATLTVATAVGHDMQAEDPELVFSAIERVVAAAGRNAAR